ncbi:DedA family protein [Microlunatus flavus]|uniref:Undecaprenyl-diphosphatase n=1 Tax=Microlunatus flavus TaxID=1036181 RepID=A0A1H8ZK42_9ACTN|nr:DedA family protein [Microlunatus flavus]SEP64633.1 undecaprenyl-diphosphatase [Microlunatus flavus]
MTQVVQVLVGLPPWLVLLVAAALPALEASAFVGLVVPGETAVFVAGVVAHGGRLDLAAVIAAAAVGAVVGDQVGYRLGRRFGPGLVDRLPGRLRPRAAYVTDLVGRRGRWAVLLGRWTALLRALVPGVAGASAMRERDFTLANVAGGLTWAGVVASLGFGAGAAYASVLKQVDHASELALGAVVVVVVVVVLVRRVLRRREGRTGGVDGASGPRPRCDLGLAPGSRHGRTPP